MPKHTPVVLVVDRESDATKSLVAFLRERGLEVVWSHDGASAHTVLDHTDIDCLVTELDTARIDGMGVLRRAREVNPELCVVVITEGAGIDKAVEAMRHGAADFQVKPIRTDKLMAVIEHGLAHQALAARVVEMEARLDERYGFERLTGNSRAIRRVVEQLKAISPTRAIVMIEGESGSGKRLVAELIHHNSPRRTGGFVEVRCGALPTSLIDSVLFGAEPGTSTGAREPKRGLFERADGGTLFLGQIDRIPPAIQVKLLRVIQDRAFERAGSAEPIRADVRLLVATDCDLATEVEAGRFREDLFYRLSAVRVAMPALRDRLEDVPLLVEAFIRESNRELGFKVRGLTRGALDRLMHHSWPGNVRELRNLIDRMVILAEGRRVLDLSDLPIHLRRVEPGGERLEIAVGMTVEEAERQLIRATLERTGRDKPQAAAILGIGLRTLYRKIKQYGIG